MKLLLIAPASAAWRHIGRNRLFNGRTFRFSLLSLLRVAAETPSDVEVQILDEQKFLSAVVAQLSSVRRHQSPRP